MPIWIADYVLIQYGTGAIMAVPAHDERDFEFAQQFGLNIRPVLEGGDVTKEAFTGDGPHINSDFLNGLAKAEAITAAIDWLEKEGIGSRKITYRLRDWLFSRQRYWGEPIPVIHWEDGKQRLYQKTNYHYFCQKQQKSNHQEQANHHLPTCMIG